MKYLIGLLTSGLLFVLVGCSPSGSSSLGTTTPTVDQQTFNSLTGVKWCQPVVTATNTLVSWSFSKDGWVVWTRGPAVGNTPDEIRQYKWSLGGKTLNVTDGNGVTFVTRDLAFDYDIVADHRIMTWTKPGTTSCQDNGAGVGNCSSTIADQIILTQCD